MQTFSCFSSSSFSQILLNCSFGLVAGIINYVPALGTGKSNVGKVDFQIKDYEGGHIHQHPELLFKEFNLSA